MNSVIIKKFIPLLIFLAVSAVSAIAQYSKTIDSLKIVEHSCLDKGWHMPQCAYQYYFQIDSLMNIVYKRLLLRLPANKRTLLAKEQRLWLKERDRYFKIQDKEYQDSVRTDNYGQEMLVIPLNAKGVFDESRLWQLIQQLPVSSVVKKPAAK